ncbi:MAG TPA: FAD-dependent oxidoreductase [Actinoplanes sp.]
MTEPRDRRVLVVGAGVAGLATAWALRRHGLTVEIVERRAQWGAEGSGLFLPANAVRALRELGLASAVTRACPVRRQRLFDHHGRRLSTVDLGKVWPGMDACVALHRTDLHAALRAAARDIPLRMGTAVTSIMDGDHPVVTCSDGSSRSYDLVIGADGIHSTVRALVFGGPAPEPVGQVSWRFVVDGDASISDWNAWLGPHRSFLAVAIGGDRTYCYADLARERAVADQDWREAFADFAEPVVTLMSRAGTAHRAEIEQITPPTWCAHRVVLVGDAAHAAPPNMAQGAAMAFEDAAVLAEVLTSGQPVDHALEAYERRRAPRAAWVLRQAYERDRTRAMAPVLRNAVLRLAAPRIISATYRPLRSAA